MSKEAFDAKKGTFFWFKTSDLVLITEQDDDLFDSRVHLPVSESMVKNILWNMQGIIEPVVICKRDNMPVVVDGRQRVKAVVEANRQLSEQGLPELLVPCVYRRDTPSGLYGLLVSANEHRTDDAPLEKGRKALRMMHMGASKIEIAGAFGVTGQTIENWITLAESPQDVQDDLRAGKATASAVIAARRVPRKQMRIAAAGTPRMRKKKEVKAAMESGDMTPEQSRVARWCLGIEDNWK